MEWEELKSFFKKYPNLKEEKPGLQKLLVHVYWREAYKISMEDAEYLAGVEITGKANESIIAWVRVLTNYRKKIPQVIPELPEPSTELSTELSPELFLALPLELSDDERKLILFYRELSESRREEALRFVLALKERGKL